MPSGSQSLQPFLAPVYTSDTASTYKGKIDANGSIMGAVAGQFYVYPTSPATLGVNVDSAWNILRVGNAVINQTTASPQVISLVAPGVGSYFATIYYDSNSGICGGTYGTATTGTPAIVFPSQTWQMPLAAVLIAAGQSSVQANNILDLRGLNLLTRHLGKTISGTATQDCTGATRVEIVFTITANNQTLTLTNLMQGAEINVVAFNNSGASATFFLSTFLIGGTNAPCFRLFNSGSPVSLTNSGSTLSAGQIFQYNGVVQANGSVYLAQS
jgi:hypothetical protein